MKNDHNNSSSERVDIKPLVVVPDDYADVDGIGYQNHVQVLVEMILSVESKGSFTIGVFGDWGQGKTSMLRQIKRTLDELTPEGRDPTLTVWFNPWQFAGEEHLIVPFFHTMVASLQACRAAAGSVSPANAGRRSGTSARRTLATAVSASVSPGQPGEAGVLLALGPLHPWPRFCGLDWRGAGREGKGRGEAAPLAPGMGRVGLAHLSVRAKGALQRADTWVRPYNFFLIPRLCPFRPASLLQSNRGGGASRKCVPRRPLKGLGTRGDYPETQ